MKKRLLNAGLCAAAMLFTGAVAVSTIDALVIETRTVDSLSGLVEKYIEFREQMGPIVPPGVMIQDIPEMMAKGDWSFLAQNWFFTFDGETLYVPEKSTLAKELRLPARIQMREDLKTGQIYIFRIPLLEEKTQTVTGLAAFDAPEFMPYEEGFPFDRYAFDELSPRRVIWDITLKSEADAWSDLLNVRQTLLSAEDAQAGVPAPQMMMMSVPAEHAGDIWLALETQTNGINLNVFAPDGFTNRVEVYSCTDLVSGLWSVAGQNLYPGTNPAIWDATSTLTNRFLRAGNMDIDSDGDGLPDAREMIVHKTNPENADTDGDGYGDDWEVTYGTDPVSANLSPQGDADSDGYPNVYEYAHGSDALSSNSAPAATRYVSLTGSHTSPFTSWATASTNIQAALDAATNDYEIIAMADGTYTDLRNHEITFPSQPVMLTGTGSCSSCVVDGEYYAHPYYPCGVVIGNSSNELSWTVIRNITFKRARRLDSQPVFLCNSGRLLIDHCALSENMAGEQYQTQFNVLNNSRLVMRNTQVVSAGSFMEISGSSDVIIEQCEIVYVAGGIAVGGDCSLTGHSNKIRSYEHQKSDSKGIVAYGNAQIEGLILEGNETGIECSYFSEPQIRNCVFVDNVSAVSVNISAHPVIEYSTFTGNTNALLGPSWDESGYEQGVSVRDSIIWSNVTAVNTSAAPMSVSVSNSCVQSGLPVDGNITNAPLFEYVWHLATNSPCLNVGTVTNALAEDADGDLRLDGQPDIGADEYSDNDDDGIRNRVEISVYGTNPNLADSDGDGMTDGWEIMHGLNPLLDDADGNPDGDGLTNAQEYAAGTDPHNSDTDGDGLPDGVDADPLVADTTLPVFIFNYPTNGMTIF